jgi:hypothetical protein
LVAEGVACRFRCSKEITFSGTVGLGYQRRRRPAGH